LQAAGLRRLIEEQVANYTTYFENNETALEIEYKLFHYSALSAMAEDKKEFDKNGKEKEKDKRITWKELYDLHRPELLKAAESERLELALHAHLRYSNKNKSDFFQPLLCQVLGVDVIMLEDVKKTHSAEYENKVGLLLAGKTKAAKDVNEFIKRVDRTEEQLKSVKADSKAAATGALIY
jgi:hypothetical protein